MKALRDEVEESLALGSDSDQQATLAEALFYDYGHSIDGIIAHIQALPQHRESIPLSARDRMVLWISFIGALGRIPVRPIKHAIIALHGKVRKVA